MILRVLPGYEGLPGSRYYVNISFAPGAGMLLPTGPAAVPQIFLGNGTEQQIVVITIRAKVSGVYLNSTQVGRGCAASGLQGVVPVERLTK